MKKRHVVAGLAAVGLAAGGGLAYADPFAGDADDNTTTQGAAGPITVTMPTGDQVQVDGDELTPLDDATFQQTDLPNGDRILTPLGSWEDAADDDLRLYNVDALLRSGHTDARDVASADDLGDSMPTDGSSADDAVTVTAEFTWMDDDTASVSSSGVALNLDTEEIHHMEPDGDVAEVDLPPGDYSFLLTMVSMAEDVDVLGTVVDLELESEPQSISLDGAAAEPVDFALDDDDAQAEFTRPHWYTHLPGEHVGTGFSVLIDEPVYAYGVESDEPVDGHDAGVAVWADLLSPDGEHSYSLFDRHDDGIPADPTFAAGEADLASVEMDYASLGADVDEMQRVNLTEVPGLSDMRVELGDSVSLPSARTEYYSPDVDWMHIGLLEEEDGVSDEAWQHSEPFEAGESRDISWPSAPLSVAVPEHDTLWHNGGIQQLPDETGGTVLAVFMPVFAAPGETVLTRGAPGNATISFEGEELAANDDASFVETAPADDPDGRYTVELNGEPRSVDWTELGSYSEATWEFDAMPDTDLGVFDVSTVGFEAEGVENGYADASQPQDVTLTYTTQVGADERTCEAMTFEVSYDDGESWAEVDIDRDGDVATATLDHPEGAEYVSVRFNAEDDKGQTVEHSTIRSYGLS